MIKNISKFALISLGAFALSSCGGTSKDKAADADTTITKSETIIKHGDKAENGPETIAYTASPDTAVLGKAKEALVKVVEASAVNLQDADGKSTGAELTVKLLVTNKSTLDAKKYFSIPASDARLQLDNGTSIPGSKESGSTEPDAEASSEAVWKFQVPANANPSKLNFFLDGTRVSVGIMKE